MIIRAVLIGEGSSDRRLGRHLEELCVFCGADEATCDAPDLGALPVPPGKRTVDKLAAVMALFPESNLVFVHRDADDPDPAPRRREIHQVLADLGIDHGVAVIPVQMLEAWLLTDESAIRRAAASPTGSAPLGLPPPARVEALSDPKDVLAKAIRTAQRSKTKRRQVDFAKARAILVDRLPADGTLEVLPSWRRLRDDLRGILGRLAS